MSGIESKIGKMPIVSKPMRNFIVDDPTMEPVEPKSVLPKMNEWKQLSVQEYNDMRKLITGNEGQTSSSTREEEEDEPMRFSSTESVLETSGERTVSKDDANLLDMIVASSSQKKAKKDTRGKIEVLLGLRTHTTSKEIDGHDIGLKNLRSNQTKKVLEAVGTQKTGFDRLYTMKHMVIGFALNYIDGESVASLLGDNDSDELRIELVSNMEPSVVDELYELYVKDIGSKLSINSDNESKEVVEEIKK